MEVRRRSLYLATPIVLVLIELTIGGQCPPRVRTSQYEEHAGR